MKAKKKNPADMTVRNIRASGAQMLELKKQHASIQKRVAMLEIIVSEVLLILRNTGKMKYTTKKGKRA